MKIFDVDFVFITEFICYDDACQLKKYAQNHVDRWCKEHCNPYNSDDLKVSAITLVISFVSMNEATQASLQVVNK